MKIAQWNYLGPRSTPQEVRDLRKASFEYHIDKGMPVVHKHKWTPQDVREGRARKCPYHDISYEGSSTECPYCFGTGILGGWDDAAITFITIADAPIDTIRPTPEGILVLDTHPQFTAPWVPPMGDGDIIITADFEPDNWDIITERERYVLREVTQRTMRGFQKKVQTREYRVHQEGQIDKLPFGDYRYDVPLVFDYGAVPDPGPIPPGGDPDDYPTDGTRTSFEITVAVVGGDYGVTSSRDQDVRLEAYGFDAIASWAVRITGEEGGSIVIFDEEY